MNLKEKLQKYRGIDLKIVAYSALPIYWAMLLVSTFLHWNWRWHWGTKFAFHPTRLASTWSIQRIPLSLSLAPRTVGLCACTLVIRSLSLLTLAWSLNPCALVGMLVAWSLRACKLATSLPERSVIFWVMPGHSNQGPTGWISSLWSPFNFLKSMASAWTLYIAFLISSWR